MRTGHETTFRIEGLQGLEVLPRSTRTKSCQMMNTIRKCGGSTGAAGLSCCGGRKAWVRSAYRGLWEVNMPGPEISGKSEYLTGSCCNCEWSCLFNDTSAVCPCGPR